MTRQTASHIAGNLAQHRNNQAQEQTVHHPGRTVSRPGCVPDFCCCSGLRAPLDAANPRPCRKPGATPPRSPPTTAMEAVVGSTHALLTANPDGSAGVGVISWGRAHGAVQSTTHCGEPCIAALGCALLVNPSCESSSHPTQPLFRHPQHLLSTMHSSVQSLQHCAIHPFASSCLKAMRGSCRDTGRSASLRPCRDTWPPNVQPLNAQSQVSNLNAGVMIDGVLISDDVPVSKVVCSSQPHTQCRRSKSNPHMRNAAAIR